MSERNTRRGLAASHYFCTFFLAALAVGSLSDRASAQSLADDTSSVSTAPDMSSQPVAPGAPNSSAIPGQTQTSASAPSTSSTGAGTQGGSYTGGTSAAPITGPGATTGGGAAAPGFFHGTERIPFHFTVSIGETYDDNIFIQPHKTSDYITTLSIRGELRFGSRDEPDSNYLDLSYQPSGLLYAQHSHDDTLNQNVDFFYEHRFTRLSLSLEQTYVHAQSTNAALGGLITSNVYNTIALADFAYSDKFDIKGSFSQNFTDFENPGYTNTREWDGNFYFLYNIDPKLSIGLGPQFGFLDIQGAPNQTYQQLLAHLNYKYSDKVSLAVEGGGEYREYQGGVPGNTATPVFDLTATYLPWTDTTISLSGSRRYTPSYNFIGQDYIDTNVGLSVAQQFLQKFTFRVTAGYENDEYEFASANQTGSTREDNYFFVNPDLDWHPNDWLSVSAFYRYQEDDSSFSAFNFNDNQVGISLSATY